MNHDIRLLLVDDAVVTLAVLAKTLSHLGYKNLRACNNVHGAMEELDMAFKKGQPFDIILCDWHMPQVNGLDFLKTIRSHPSHSKVLFMMITADTDIDNIVTAVKEGADGYIFKPVTAEHLSNKIQKLLVDKRV